MQEISRQSMWRGPQAQTLCYGCPLSHKKTVCTIAIDLVELLSKVHGNRRIVFAYVFQTWPRIVTIFAPTTTLSLTTMETTVVTQHCRLMTTKMAQPTLTTTSSTTRTIALRTKKMIALQSLVTPAKEIWGITYFEFLDSSLFKSTIFSLYFLKCFLS